MQGSAYGQENHQKVIKNHLKIHPKIYIKTIQNLHAEKVCKNDAKMTKSDPQTGPKIHQNLKKSRFRKWSKKHEKNHPGAQGSRGSVNHQQT